MASVMALNLSEVIMEKKKMIEVFVAIVIAVGSYYAGVKHGVDELAQTMATEYVCIEKKW
jgi:hypothetical protein